MNNKGNKGNGLAQAGGEAGATTASRMGGPPSPGFGVAGPPETGTTNRLAAITAVAALGLICAGGLVTSHEAGMSVPDWPTTYGYNMFFFPISKWTGGILYEHSHRLIAATVGLLTVALAVWLWLREKRTWLRWTGVGAALLVVFQGVLGGLRVTERMSELGIFHATLAQLYFALLAAIALFTSKTWLSTPRLTVSARDARLLHWLYAGGTALVLLQLIIGATMRHQHAGLAIPDFPLAYGRLWPAMDPASVVRYNDMRQELTATNPITANQIALQMVHRITALLVLTMVVLTAIAARQRLGKGTLLRRLSGAWTSLIVAQVALGAATICTNKSADIATLHVAVGALSLVAGTTLVLLARRSLEAVVAGPAPAGEAAGERRLPPSPAESPA